MKKGLTELVFILDRSGSMSGLEADTIGGFNSMIEKQKQEEGEAFLTTVLFDSKVETVNDRVKLENVKPLTEKQYFVRGTTALLDALGMSITHISNIHKYAREEDVPEKTLFIITTDGMENSSRTYSRAQVKELIEAKKEEGWEFIFLGATLDAVEEAESIGISRKMASRNTFNIEGIHEDFAIFNHFVSGVRNAPGNAKESMKYMFGDDESYEPADDGESYFESIKAILRGDKK